MASNVAVCCCSPRCDFLLLHRVALASIALLFTPPHHQLGIASACTTHQHDSQTTAPRRLTNAIATTQHYDSPPTSTNVRVDFETPVVVGSASGTAKGGLAHFYFPATLHWANASTQQRMLMSVSNSADSLTACTANCSRLMASTDAGRSWSVGAVDPAPAAQVADASISGESDMRAPCVGPQCLGLTNTYVQALDGGLFTLSPAQAPISEPNSSTLFAVSRELVTSADGTISGGKSASVPVTGLPPLYLDNSTAGYRPAVYLSRTRWVTLNGSKVLIAVGHGMDAEPFIGQNVKKTTVFVFRSDDSGGSFRFLSRVPCRSSIAPWCERAIGGPSEPTFAQLPDSRLLMLFRTTGTPCMSVVSSDGGRSWSSPQLSPVWSVWPQLEVLPNGIIVASSGRPSLAMWWSASSDAAVAGNWTYQNVASKHNALLPNKASWHYNQMNVDCPQWTEPENQCDSCWEPAKHCARQTTSYTALHLLEASSDAQNATVLLSYDRCDVPTYTVTLFQRVLDYRFVRF